MATAFQLELDFLKKRVLSNLLRQKTIQIQCYYIGVSDVSNGKPLLSTSNNILLTNYLSNNYLQTIHAITRMCS